jgi:hypothetical protein
MNPNLWLNRLFWVIHVCVENPEAFAVVLGVRYRYTEMLMHFMIMHNMVVCLATAMSNRGFKTCMLPSDIDDIDLCARRVPMCCYLTSLPSIG